MAKITVVIPIYNMEKFLNRCLYSIINQSFKDLEIILVNDGSTDLSGKMCDDYKNMDNRIVVIHQENQGLSQARNSGILLATSSYIGFIDSDDWVNIDFYKNLYNTIRNYNADISSCSYQEIFNEDDVNSDVWNEDKTIVMTKDFALKKLLTSSEEGSHTAWNKLYKASLFENIKYPKGRIYEDASTTYKLFFLSKTITYNPAKFLYYWQRDDSIMSRKFDERNMDKLIAVDEMYDFFDKQDKDYLEYVDAFKVVSALRMAADILPDEKKNFLKEYKIIESILLDKKNIDNKYLKTRHKFLLIIFRLSKKTYSKIWQKRLRKR